ncbi:MAG: ferritin family protein [Candidatus ainarchaeum sp.]|nr:ferritin family protein [Candidatus ainarchaeum sp.]
MMSEIPAKIVKLEQKETDKEILRAGIIAELDAVSLYEQMAAMTRDPKIKAVLMDIAKEEKTHAGEFQALLVQLDPQQGQELAAGKKEVDKLAGEL